MSVLTNVRSRIADAVEAGPIGRVRRIVVGVVRETLADDVMGLSAELAYRWLLAIFPLAILIAAISGFVAASLDVQDPSEQLLDAAGEALPPEAAATIRPQLASIFESRSGALFSLGLVLAVWAAAGGMRAIIKALNRAYDVQETRPFWLQILLAVVMTLLLGGAIVVSFIGMVAGQVAATDIAAAVGLQEATAWIVEYTPYVVTVLALGAATWLLYWRAPARQPSAWRALPGVLLFVPGWIVATVLFSFYVANFGSYANTYGALGGVIVLMLWFYLTGVILLVGGELNAVIDRELGDGAADGKEEADGQARGEPLAEPEPPRAEEPDARG